MFNCELESKQEVVKTITFPVLPLTFLENIIGEWKLGIFSKKNCGNNVKKNESLINCIKIGPTY